MGPFWGLRRARNKPLRHSPPYKLQQWIPVPSSLSLSLREELLLQAVSASDWCGRGPLQQQQAIQLFWFSVASRHLEYVSMLWGRWKTAIPTGLLKSQKVRHKVQYTPSLLREDPQTRSLFRITSWRSAPPIWIQLAAHSRGVQCLFIGFWISHKRNWSEYCCWIGFSMGRKVWCFPQILPSSWCCFRFSASLTHFSPFFVVVMNYINNFSDDEISYFISGIILICDTYLS